MGYEGIEEGWGDGKYGTPIWLLYGESIGKWATSESKWGHGSTVVRRWGKWSITEKLLRLIEIQRAIMVFHGLYVVMMFHIYSIDG